MTRKGAAGDKKVKEKELVLAGAKARRRFRARLEGATLVQTSWVEGGAPKEAKKTFDDEASASLEYGKAWRKKMRDGYTFLAEGPVPFGGVVHESFAGGGGGGPVLDLSPDGRQAVTASIGPVANFGCKLHLIDVVTGARRVVWEEPAGTTQNFLHVALFRRDGAGVYHVHRNTTCHLDLATGERRQLADCGSHDDPDSGERFCGFNPFVVRPQFDRERRRLLVFAEHGAARVVDAGAGERALLEVRVNSRTAECRAAALSASGARLALYVASRYVIYSHDDARDDTTNEIQIWDVDRGARLATLPVDEHLRASLHFSPDDRTLLVTNTRGCQARAIDLSDGRASYDVGALAELAAFSPDGRLFAAGGRSELYDAATRERVLASEGDGYRNGPVIFSGDGRLLAEYNDGRCVVRSLDPDASGAPFAAAPRSP
jgi:sugar lactone lactonase YvrE